MANLTVAEERENHPDAAFLGGLEDVTRDFMPLVRHVLSPLVAATARASILDYEDLLSSGVQGLIEAYHAYDPARGAKFSTYAVPRIRGSILDAIRAAHPLSRSLQKASASIEKATTGLYTDLGRPPTKAEVAERLGISLKDLVSSSRLTNIRTVSLEGLSDFTVSGATEKMIEMADDDPNGEPETAALRAIMRNHLITAIAHLPQREQQIVKLYYLKSKSLKSIGGRLGVSESRVSQLRHRAIRRLRDALGGELLEAA